MELNINSSTMNNDEYIMFFVELGCFSNEENFDLYETYAIRKEKEFDGDRFDETMIQIIRESNNVGITHNIMKVKKQFKNFVKFTKHIMYEEVTVDLNEFKINLITKLISSERECNDSIHLIENILFDKYDTKIEIAN